MFSYSGALTPITRTLCATHSTQNTTLSFLLFIVIVCFGVQTERRQCASPSAPVSAFKRRKSRNLLHSFIVAAKSRLLSPLELEAFRFGGNSRALAGQPHLNARLMDAFTLCPHHFVSGCALIYTAISASLHNTFF